MRAPSAVTLALTAASVVMVALVHADPWVSTRAPAALLSTQSMARRLFPTLGEADLARATIRLRSARGELRLAPGDDGLHQLWQDDAPLGWADGEALAGLWGSLRMATTLRAVAPGSELGPPRGEIAVSLDDQEFVVQVGGATGDGAGLYGVLTHEGEAAWVVEPELGEVLDQGRDAWLLRRLLPLEPADAIALAWDGLDLARGADGLWRVTGGAPKLLLAEQAVALRLGQALSADLDPLFARAEAPRLGPFTAGHRITDAMGHVRTVLSGGTCPGRQERIVVDRGPGLLGCVDRQLLAAWPVADPDSGLLEPQLAPHAYGRVLAVEQAAPHARRLRRFGGGWVIEEDGALVEVAEPEVFRWYAALQATEVELGADDLTPGFTPTQRLTIETDSGQTLRLACGPAGALPLACARDDGPPLRVVGSPPALAFGRETFADRRLLSLRADEVRSLEILPGGGAPGVRQSVRLDLGVWRLDAPAHPDGVAVLDEVRLESMLAALASLRAEAWTAVPGTGPLRSIRVERTRGGPEGAGELAIDLHAGCIGHIPGQKQAAQLGASACEALADDLLYNDPLRFWLGQARSLQLTDLLAPGERVVLLRRDDADSWTVESGDAALAEALGAWEGFRSAGIRSGEPPGAAALQAKIWRAGVAAIRIDLGPIVDGAPAWVRLTGSPWFYPAASP
jgi:hypothetical protein